MTRGRLVIAVGVLLLVAAGVVGAIAYLNARDDATVSTTEGPGEERPDGESPTIKRPGNVLLLYSDPELAGPLRMLQRELAGPDTRQLVSAGQAIVVRRQADLPAPVVALSARHRLQAVQADSEDLRAFVEYWLGRGSG